MNSTSQNGKQNKAIVLIKRRPEAPPIYSPTRAAKHVSDLVCVAVRKKTPLTAMFYSQHWAAESLSTYHALMLHLHGFFFMSVLDLMKVSEHQVFCSKTHRRSVQVRPGLVIIQTYDLLRSTATGRVTSTLSRRTAESGAGSLCSDIIRSPGHVWEEAEVTWKGSELILGSLVLSWRLWPR